MASACNRLINRASLSTIRSAVRSSDLKPLSNKSTSSTSSPMSTRLLQMSSGTGATLQCSGCCKDDIMPKHNLKEL